MPEEEIPIFARRATGLVREIGPLGLMAITMCYCIGAGINFLAVKNGALYPGSNVGLAFLLTGIPVTLVALSYALLAIMMPRSGGAYIFVSRILSPTWGFLVSWISFCGGWLLVGIVAYYDAFFWGTMFWCIGIAFHNEPLANVGIWLMDPVNAFWLGILALVITFIICSLRITTVVRILEAVWIIPLIGGILMILTFTLNIGVAAVTPEKFKAIWDSIMGEGSYDEVMRVALAHGFDPDKWTTFSWDATWSVASYAAIFAYGSPATPPTSVAGEVKVPTKTQMLGTVLGTIFVVFYYTAISATMYAACDPFIRAYTFNFIYGYWDEYTITPRVTPTIPLFAGILTQNLGLATFYAVAAALWLWNVIPTFFIYLSRFIFAWAFDRVFPMFFAKVHPTLRSPIYANLLVLILGIIACLLCWGWWIYKVFTLLDNVACLGWIFPDMFVSLAATVAPIVRPDVYKESPISTWKILGIPVISIVGILSFAGISLIIYMVIGTLTPGGIATPDIMLFVGMIAIGLIICTAFWYRNIKKGIPVSEIYRAIPPA